MITKNNSGMQMSKRNSLYEEMKKFQKEKKLYFFVLIGVGLLEFWSRIIGINFPGNSWYVFNWLGNHFNFSKTWRSIVK